MKRSFGKLPVTAKTSRLTSASSKGGLRYLETFEAKYIGHPDGVGYSGFLRPLGPSSKRSDVLVDWGTRHGALHGDHVLAEITGEDRKGRPKARVIKIIKFGTQTLAGTLQKQAWGWRVLPLEHRIGSVINVPPTDIAKEGEWVSVELQRRKESTQLEGKVVARLGKKGDLRIENQLTAEMFGIRQNFPAEVMQELAPFPTNIAPEWLRGREDLRKHLTCTIDPPTAKDFDDAISIETIPPNEGGGWLLGVHIADVSFYVKEDGSLDQEARLRGTSVYFPDECIPMIPERLSGDLCSLREGVDRLTLTAWIRISDKFDITHASFSESVIHSRKRLTYNDVRKACTHKDPILRAALGTELCHMLETGLVVAEGLRTARLTRGAINLDTEETEFHFDEKGKVVWANPYQRHNAHQMIEEFMLLANEAVARFFNDQKVPTIFRIHDEPDPIKLEIFANLARTFGLLTIHEGPTPDNLNRLLTKVRGGGLEALMNTMLLRSLKRAEYSADNIGHSGLALKDYLHFTSPIRRYPDLIVHRSLRKILRKELLPNNFQSQLAIIARECSDAEQQATEAERENIRWKACDLMRPFIGKTFQGFVQGFSSKAIYIQLQEPFVEIGTPIGALGLGFKLDEYRTKLVGSKGSVAISIGDFVTVELAGIDEDQHRIFGWIIEAKSKDGKGKTYTFNPNRNAITQDIFEKPKRSSSLPRKSKRTRSSKKKKGGGRFSGQHKKDKKRNVRGL